jgi:hypothetical protein
MGKNENNAGKVGIKKRESESEIMIVPAKLIEKAKIGKENNLE